MPIKHGSENIIKVYKGTDEMLKMYNGSEVISLGGLSVSSILGKENTFTHNGTGTSANYFITRQSDGPTVVAGTNFNISITSGHKIFVLIKFNNWNRTLRPTTSFGINTESQFSGNIAINENLEWKYIWTLSSNYTLDNFRTFDFGNFFDYVNDRPSVSYIIALDLTELGLTALTAQQVYDYITHNGTKLSNLTTLANGQRIVLSAL